MTKQLAIDFTRYPESPGFKRRGTSERAAREVKPRQRSAWQQVLEVLRQYDMTSDEIASALNRSILFVRPRLSELVKLGRIEDSGVRRTNDSGQLATVWKIKGANGNQETDN